jgi:hypothetical protein
LSLLMPVTFSNYDDDGTRSLPKTCSELIPPPLSLLLLRLDPVILPILSNDS